jgi:lipoprotein-anchoring transpeptidase ErfK/SrfK
MKIGRRTIVGVALAVVVPVALAFAGWGIVAQRAHGTGVTLALPASTPTASPSVPAPRPVQHWTVGKATQGLVVRAAPSDTAAVRWRLPKFNASHYPQLVLVDKVREIGGVTWFYAYVAAKPNESRGWIREGSLALYQTTSKIVIDLSKHRLYVFVRGIKRASFKVAVGSPQYPTPTGFFFIIEKLRPASPNGPYGVLGLGLSAFQPLLSDWPLGGVVGIHGTNQDELIGKSVSHGCIRMHNADILAVSDMVPAGSPVVIQK